MPKRQDFANIPDGCRDQHLAMIPEFARSFKEHGIRGIGIHEMIEPYEIFRNPVNWHLLIITLDGQATYEAKNQRGVIREHEIWVGPADLAYGYKAKGKWKFISVALFATDTLSHLEGKITHRPAIYDTAHLISAAEAYQYEVSLNSTKENTGQAESLAKYLSSAISREIIAEDSHGWGRNQPGINRLWEAVHATPSADWNLQELSNRVNLSIRQFQRLMRKNYNLTAEQMLLRIRMGHARELLIDSNLSMDMIAEKIGYQSVFSFSKAFKRYFEMPPGSYRKKYHS